MQIRREKVHALILSRRNSGEADRVLTLFTRPYGLLRATAPGVRKIPSRRGGHVEPFSHVLAILSGRPGRLYAAAVETQNNHSPLRESPSALECAQELSRLILRLFTEEQSQPILFDALHQSWEMLPNLPPAAQNMLRTAISLLALHRAGVMPDLSACQVCGVQQPRDAVILDGEHGGWRCLACHDSFQGTRASLSPRLLKAVRFIARYPERALHVQVTAEESTHIAAAIHTYCSALADERPAAPATYPGTAFAS